MAEKNNLIPFPNQNGYTGMTNPPSGGGSEPPMELAERVAKLESLAEKAVDRLNTLERDVAVIKSNYSTKADVADAKNSIIMWVVSAVLLAQLLPALLKKFGL